MNEREKHLLMEGYGAGRAANAVYQEATLKQLAEEWVETVIADNGGTVGQFICHHAPGVTVPPENYTHGWELRIGGWELSLLHCGG